MKLRIATLNVWGLPEPLARDVTPRIKAIGERLGALDADVVAFQETFRPDARAALLEAGRRVGLVNAWHSRSTLGGGGLLTLSRLPIEAARFERYSARGQAEQIQLGEYISGKGFAKLQLRTSEGPIQFLNTHLHARYTNEFPHEFEAHRIAQIVQLAAASVHPTQPVIVAGDFNAGEHQTEYGVLTGLTGLRDTAAELGLRIPTVYGTNPYRHPLAKSKRIDFVFRRDGASRSVEALHSERVFDAPVSLPGREVACSNHAGVLAEVEIRARRRDTPVPAPLAWAVGEAQRLLAQGRAGAERRRREMRTLSGAGLASVVAATAGGRSSRMSRRGLLRLSLRGAALAALTPTVGYSMLSEVFVPTEINGFEDAEAQLAQLVDPLPGGALAASDDRSGSSS
jgi:endonuclease/exonuclease/phosphatase family metal-dependent hydrolase